MFHSYGPKHKFVRGPHGHPHGGPCGPGGVRHARSGFGPGGPFGPLAFGPGGAWDRPFGGGRGRRRRGDVRTALLLLLVEEPRNGYQLMQLIEERSDGRWRPSPGAVYPALAQLEDEGLIRSVEGSSGKLLEITDAGRERAAERGDQAPPWESDESEAAGAADLRKLIGGVAAAAMQVAHQGGEEHAARAAEILADARKALYRILAEDPS